MQECRPTEALPKRCPQVQQMAAKKPPQALGARCRLAWISRRRFSLAAFSSALSSLAGPTPNAYCMAL